MALIKLSSLAFQTEKTRIETGARKEKFLLTDFFQIFMLSSIPGNSNEPRSLPNFILWAAELARIKETNHVC